MKNLTIAFSLVSNLSFAQAINYDESKIPPYTLPDVVTAVDGQKIRTVKQWEANRPALLKLFAENVYGTTSKLTFKQHFLVTKTKEVFGGKAIQKQVSIFFDDYPTLSPINILLYVPKGVKNPPVFMGLNFEGNHSLILDADIPITKNWMLEYKKDSTRVKNHQALEGSRGTAGIETWPFEKIISAGFAVATAYCGDIEPDYPEGWKTSLRGVIGNRETNTWGAMGAWAWGLSRMLDYVQSDKDIDGKKAIVVGHSRLGKAAFWAAAQDTRFAAYISNESGEGGAALARRWYGETVEIINTKFPHWFSDKFKTYNQNVNALPIDQHQLVALIAPRPIYISSAEEDQWSDPTGEFLSLKNAKPVYQLYSKKTFAEEARPPVDQPIGSHIRYHYRSGKHNMTVYDWEQYLKFAAEVVR